MQPTSNKQKELDIRARMKQDDVYETAIASIIASCLSSNKGGDDERIMELALAQRLIETTSLVSLAEYVASHNDTTGDNVFNLWWLATNPFQNNQPN